MNSSNKIYIVMGVSGSGKTTIGKLLANRLNISFFDGDDFHSKANIQKMSNGQPLDDNDRYEWLKAINKIAITTVSADKSAVIACSALKEKYRVLLSENIKDSVIWICLNGGKDIILKRIDERKGHYMPASLLQSQFDILEIPFNAIMVDIASDTNSIINQVIRDIEKSSLGIVGLGVMGKSLARNWARSGIRLSIYNRFVPGIEEGIAEKAIQQYPELHASQGFEDLKLFVNSLQKPRKIFMMIKAGTATDIFISEILPCLDAGDILIDGGNAHFADTKRRINFLQEKQIHFIGAGVSGGEQGALNGPSIMPSGLFEAYRQIEQLLCVIAAKDKNGKACCHYIGPEGSGHFVKMVHNGIEYAEMQLIAEAYAYLRFVHLMEPPQISAAFAEWNKGSLNSFLLEITVNILQKKEGDCYLIDSILDVAGNKGTGNWATIAASELGFPSGMITAALFARYVSTLKESIRSLREKNLSNTELPALAINQVKGAYTIARIANHQQGFLFLKAASEEFNWNLNLSEIARLWTNGCIIRSALMDKLVVLLSERSDLFATEEIKNEIALLKPALKEFCIHSIQSDLAIPCHTAALDYLNVLHANYATANIIQAQRDYFGSHMYQIKGDTTGRLYHTKW